jgi:hypothetical protein
MILNSAETNRRYAAARAELRARGVLGNRKPAPPSRLLSWLGFEPRPLPYLSWKQGLVFYGLGFVIAQLFVDPLLGWTTGLSLSAHTVDLVLTALIFGAGMSFMQIWRRHRLGLSDWDML